MKKKCRQCSDYCTLKEVGYVKVIKVSNLKLLKFQCKANNVINWTLPSMFNVILNVICDLLLQTISSFVFKNKITVTVFVKPTQLFRLHKFCSSDNFSFSQCCSQAATRLLNIICSVALNVRRQMFVEHAPTTLSIYHFAPKNIHF